RVRARSGGRAPRRVAGDNGGMALDTLRRGALPTLAIVALVALTIGTAAVGLEAWAGLYPRSPLLARAANWPLVGDWVALARARHAHPRAPRQPIAARRVVRPTP